MSRFNVPYVGTEPPKVSEIWAVVPLSRPEMVGRVSDNWERQRIRPRLIVVENGRGVGACKAQGLSPDVLLESEAHQSTARNAALAYLREHHPDAYWVAMDDDDYYGPEYVAEHAGLAERGKLVGKMTHWALFEGRFLALFRPWSTSRPINMANGGTLGAYVSDSPEFVRRDHGEDGDFVAKFLRNGGKAWSSSPYHYAYCRRGDGREDHTFPCMDEAFVFHMGAEYLVFPPDRLDLVRAEAPVDGGKLFNHPELP